MRYDAKAVLLSMRSAVPTDNRQEWLEFERLVGDIGTGLLTTAMASGELHTRPLQTLRVTREALWFFTDLASPKADELRHDVRVCVGYADIARHRFAAVSGRGHILQDRALARELWRVDQRAYYPDGPDDPRLGLLQVWIERAEYWLAPGRGAYYLAALQAAVSGRAVQSIGENHKL